MRNADLKKWQKAMGLTQHQAANELGISLATYKDWINGISRNTGRPVSIDRRTELACFAISYARGQNESAAEQFIRSRADLTALMNALDAAGIESNRDGNKETKRWEFSDGSMISIAGPEISIIPGLKVCFHASGPLAEKPIEQ